MDIRSFARGNNKKNDAKEPIRDNPADRMELEKTVEELGKKSESELMSELLQEVNRGKQDGSFTNDALAEFMGKVSPMLTPEQLKRMEEITSRLKM